MTTSRVHADAVCLQWESCGINAEVLVTSAVDAVAARPHRDGISQEMGSSARSVIGIMPPTNTTCTISVTTVSGSTWLLVCASDDTNRPRIADATHVAAMPTNSSSVGLPNRFASGSAPLPIVTISTRMADWITAIAPNTAILAARYADVDSPTACGWEDASLADQFADRQRSPHEERTEVHHAQDLLLAPTAQHRWKRLAEAGVPGHREWQQPDYERQQRQEDEVTASRPR